LSSPKALDSKEKTLPSVDISKEKGLFVLPTLVVLWSRDEKAMNDLQEGVRHRLAPLDEIGALKWIGPFSSERELTGEGLARACETLLSWDLWQRLVERGYQPHAQLRSPAHLQVIFIVDQLKGEGKGSPLGVIGEAQKLLARRARLTPILVWLGSKPEPPPEDLNVYWPRIRMEPVAASGVGVAPRQVMEATQHLLVALVGSNFVQIIEPIVKKAKAEWIVVGASALLLHPRIEEWLRGAVLREILSPLVTPIPETEINRIEKAMSERARKVRESLLEEALEALKESGWKIEVKDLAIQKCVLRKPELLNALFGPYQGGVATERLSFREWKNWPRQFWTLISALAEPFFPDPTIIRESLYRHYRELSEKLEQWLGEKWRGLAPRALEEYRDLRVLLGAFLDRGLTAQIPPEKQPSWWFSKPPLPTGLPAAITALLALQKHLCEGSDLEEARGLARERVRPAPLNDDAYLRAAGDTDAQIVRGNLLRYAHFARTLASPWGVFLYLLPAWPLAAFLVQFFLTWGPAQGFLVTGLALFLIGVVELAYWWFWKARQLLKAVQSNAHRALASRVMTLTARAIQDYRYWMLSRLREAEFVLADLYLAFLQRWIDAEKASRALSEAHSQEVNGCTYLLVYEKEIQRWREEAVKALRQYPDWRGESDQFESALIARIVAKVWPLPEQPLPSQAMLKELEAACARVVKDCARPGIWKAAVAAEMEVDPLKGGERWNWLWQRAYPLGIVESPGEEFTVVIASEESLSGSTGRGSPYWQPSWRVALTLQEQEEMCIRGIVERKRGE